jgi:hypothetical protein
VIYGHLILKPWVMGTIKLGVSQEMTTEEFMQRIAKFITACKKNGMRPRNIEKRVAWRIKKWAIKPGD